MPLIPFPNVPKLPGVPPLNRAGYNAASQTAAKVIAAAAGLKALGLVAQARSWQILDASGKTLLNPDTVLSLEYRGEAKISTYPVEGGGFSSYNKVRVPADLHIVMTCAGTGSGLGTGIGTGKQSRESFLAALAKLKDGVTLATIVTPDAVYKSFALIEYDMQRTSKSGVTMLTVSASFQEVAETATAERTQTAQPAGAPMVAGGAVKAEAPTAAQAPKLTGVQ